MWTRPLLKSNAKQVLSRGYWHIFAATLIASLLGAGIGGGGFTYTLQNNGSSSSGSYGNSYASYYGNYDFGNVPEEFWAVFGTVFVVIFLVVFAIGLCWAVFLSNPISVGLSRFLMESRMGTSPIGTLFSLFRKGIYMNVVKGMFFTNLKIFLWSLLLIVPGVIKSYEYCMVPFLLAENPQMDSKRAQELSRLMTDNEKWNIFVLGLSFLGWELLAALVSALVMTVFSLINAGFGQFMLVIVGFFTSLLVATYYNATFAELYTALREKAFSMNISNQTELGGFVRY